MRTRISVILNGTALHEINPLIVLQGVDEGAASWTIAAGNRAGKDGQYINSIEKRSRDVVVNFAIAEKQDLNLRSAIIQQVCAWAAKGGELKLSYRDRQRLRVVCAQLPAVKTLTKWAESYSITFRAYAVPFWESIDAESANIASGTSGSATLNVKESAGGKLCCEATNNSGSTLNTASIAANGKSISLSGLGMANGDKLLIDYDDRDIQRIRTLHGGTYTSVLGCRTTNSDDDVPLKCGDNTVTVTSGGAMSWKVYTYGRWE